VRLAGVKPIPVSAAAAAAADDDDDEVILGR